MNHSAIFFIGILFLSACTGGSDQAKTNPTDTAIQATVPAAAPASTVAPANPPANFKHQVAEVNGVRIHYVIGGEGEPLVLVHGFGQNWYMWNRLLPELSKHFTVIAPDLRGLGESSKPDSGYDKKTMAVDIHELVKKLGYKSIKLAGHDIGLMVAYAYAAQFPEEVKKVALLDALLPGVEPVWGQARKELWWFGFFARPASGDIVSGRERLFLTDFWPVVGHKKDLFTQDESEEFIRAYSQPGSMKAAFKWFANFPQDAIDNLQFMKKKLGMPFLTVGAEFQSAPFLEDHIRLVATNVKGVKIPGAGHWVVQENTAPVQKALLDFFMDK